MSALESWHEERQSAWLYRELAACEPAAHVASLFTELAAAAERQALYWESLMRADGHAAPTFTPEWRARLAATLARTLGARRLKPLLAALKVRGLSAYSAAVPSGHTMPTHHTEVGRGHRAVGGGNLRAAIFGVNDGLVSNASLIMGMVGASADTGIVLTTGIAGLLAGALSMASGEYVSVRSQRELFEHQIALEKAELAEYPEAEAEELALIYATRGLGMEEARVLATRMVSDPAVALDVLSREELGLNPDDLGSPLGAAGFSFAAFTVGALIPLLPFFLGSTLPMAALLGVALTAAALFGTGAAMSLFTGRNAPLGGLRMLAIGGGAGALTFAIGHLVGGVG
ncbi:MAG: VIT1/CCC1 transporter family protein [Xanthomonadaceae bacterium]|nr:VIT1/CCC1 transporter family protein [Xanthomonadaceae bacterium]